MSEPVAEKEAGPAQDTPIESQSIPNNEPEKRKREYKEFGEEEKKPQREYCAHSSGKSLNFVLLNCYFVSQMPMWICLRSS